MGHLCFGDVPVRQAMLTALDQNQPVSQLLQFVVRPEHFSELALIRGDAGNV
jgi:hypothetical protein